MFLPPKFLSYWKHAAVLVAIVAVAAGGYFIWSNYFKYDPVKVYKEAEERYVAAMTADTYGGKTPQETLDMFVAALRAGDVELASKYFLLDENASREKGVQLLQENERRGVLKVMADSFATAELYKSPYDGVQQFVIYNEAKTDSLIVTLRINRHANVWKIESL